ncbi:MAG: hypothetical protein GIKADHBN_02959 [Phycisphaerales bacterium]|nr:hypothetical protein [Phycisphaerales bacterium]
MGAPVVHFEIGARDATKLAGFYGKLFGWNTSEYGPARMIDTGSTQGIMGHINQLGHEPHNYCVVYMQVDDLEAYIKNAMGLGAKLCVPATEVPGMGHFAWLQDPEGNAFGLWKAAGQ